MPIVRELITRLGFDVKETDLKKAEARVDKLKSRIKIGMIAAAGAIGLIGISAIKAAADMESMTTQFEVMLGSADKATDIMEKLKDFASGTPFQLKDLALGTQQLVSAGVAADDAISTMRMLGDTAGGNAEKLKGLTLGYQKMMSTGKASLEVLNIFAERGIPVFGEMQKNLGVTKDQFFKMVSAGKIATKDVTNAFKTMTSQGGLFFKGMEKASLTFDGVVSTMKDNISLTLAELGSAALPVLKEMVTAFTEFAKKVRKSINANKVVIQEFITGFMEGVKRVVGWLLFLGKIIAAVLGNEFARNVLIALGAVMLFVKGLAILKAVFLTIHAVMTVIAATNPFLLIAAAVVFAAVLIWRYWEPISKFFKELWENMIRWVKNAILIYVEIWKVYFRMLKNIGNKIKKFIISIFKDPIGSAKKAFTSYINLWINYFKFIQKIGRNITKFLTLLFTSPTEAIKFAWEGLKDFVGGIWDWMTAKISALVNWVNKIPGIDIKIPAMEKTIDTVKKETNNNQKTTNVSMENNITFDGAGGLTAENVGTSMKQAAKVAFSLELKKLLVSVT